jgi:cyanophycin synthetase
MVAAVALAGALVVPWWAGIGLGWVAAAFTLAAAAYAGCRSSRSAAYVGPNLYANFRVIRLTARSGPLEDCAFERHDPRLRGRLVGGRPEPRSTAARTVEPGGFIRRMREDGGTWLGTRAGARRDRDPEPRAAVQVTFGKTRGAGASGHYHVVYEYEDAWVGEQAGELALRLLHHLVPAELRPGVACPRRLQLPARA